VGTEEKGKEVLEPDQGFGTVASPISKVKRSFSRAEVTKLYSLTLCFFILQIQPCRCENTHKSLSFHC